MITQLQSIVGFRELSVEKEVTETVSEAAAEEEGASDPTKMKIEELNLSTRTENALVVASIRSVGGLVRKSEEDLLALDGLGEKAVTEIKKALQNLGLSLKA